MGKQTLSAQDAAAAIAEVKEYRQGLTVRAVGTLWIVWGLILAIFAMQDLFLPASQVAGHFRDHSVYDLGKIWPAWLLVNVGLLFAAIAATYAVWHSHAIAKGEPVSARQRAKAFGGYVLIIAIVLVAITAIEALLNIGRSFPDPYISVFGNAHAGFSHMAFPIVVAATIAFKTRAHVGWRPPAIGLVAMTIIAQILGIWPGWDDVIADYEGMSGNVLAQGLAISTGVASFTVMTTFTAIGLYYYLRG